MTSSRSKTTVLNEGQWWLKTGGVKFICNGLEITDVYKSVVHMARCCWASLNCAYVKGPSELMPRNWKQKSCTRWCAASWQFYFCRGPLQRKVVSIVDLPQVVSGSKFSSQLGLVCVEFACSSHVCVGFLRALQFPSTAQGRADEVNWLL